MRNRKKQDQKQLEELRTISAVWKKADCSKHHCTTEPMSWKKCVNRHCEAGLYGRIVDKNPQLRKQNTIKRFQRVKAHKDRTIEQWNKVFYTDKSTFKIFGSNRRVYVWWRVGERAETPCIRRTVKHGGGSVMVCVCVWGAFVNWKVGDLHQVKSRLN